MKRISLIAVAASVAAILACGGGDDDNANGDDGSGSVANSDDGSGGNNNSGGLRASELPTVAMTTPWSGMGLPVAGGNVVVSDSNVLLVAYDGGSIASYASSYGAAVERDGWSKSEDYSTPDFTAILYTKAGGELGMAVGVEEGINFVYFENLKNVPENESSFRSARSGKRPSIAGRVKRRGKTKPPTSGGGGGGKKKKNSKKRR